MKKIIILLTIFCSIYTFSTAQTNTNNTDSKLSGRKGMTKEGKPDMRLKANKANKVAVETKTTTTKSTTTQSTGLNKNGTPDMRLKVNKERMKPAPAVNSTNSSPASATNNTRTTTSQRTTTVNTTDKVIETDAKGRTIYEGPRGGHYYINKNGHKEYIKK